MSSAIAGSVAGWLTIVFVLIAAAVAVILRRLRRTPPLARRMRPHYTLGYAALACAAVHVYFAMGAMRGEDSGGLWAASAAFVALGTQTFVGASLQDPGGYRRALRAWHLGVIAALIVLIVMHVTENGALAP